MCEITYKEDTEGNIHLLCESSGKPIVESNDYGMFCEDLCGMEEMKEKKDIIAEMLMRLSRGLV